MAGPQKITLLEMIALIAFVLITDVLGFVFGFLGPVGAVLNFIMTVAVFPITFFYLRTIKKTSGIYDLAANALEGIPVLSMLPVRTIGMIIEIIKLRSESREEGRQPEEIVYYEEEGSRKE